MHRAPNPSRFAAMAFLVAAAVLLAVGCSSDDGVSPPSTPASGSAPGSTAGTTVVDLTDEERLALAKTVAVGFFEAQAVNAYDQALGLSSDAAALTIEWARAVNSIAAADDSGYQVPTVQAPNVRVQIDALEADGADQWLATGFVELSFRPGPVVSTTSTTAPSGAPTTQVAPSEAPGAFVVDLVFAGDGDQLRLADYRLDDVPYPVSELFEAFAVPADSAAEVEGAVVLGHRDLDGSVQYVVDLSGQGGAEVTVADSSFTPAPAGESGTSTIPPDASTIEGTTFADPVPATGTSQALVVFPGGFPGSAGTLSLTLTGAGTTTTQAGAEDDSTLAWALPEPPTLTPRPVGTVTSTSSTTTSSTTTSSTTSTTSTTAEPATPTTEPSTTAPTTSAPPSTVTSTTSTSTTTTTEP